MEYGIWDLTLLDRMSRARGLRIDRINPSEDLLLPPSGSSDDLESYRDLLDHYAVRLLLREVINTDTIPNWQKGRRSLEKFCDPDAVDGYLAQLEALGVIIHSTADKPVVSKPVSSFGATYEWYVFKVLSGDFACPSAWGVRFSDTKSGGDHDVIADLYGKFLYMEVKTAPPKHIEQSEVTGFVRRLMDIAPDIAIFHDDTHLRMKDKIVPLMEEGIKLTKAQSPKSKGIKTHDASFQRLEREIFHLDSSIYIVNSKPDLKRNLKVIFRHYFRSESRILTSLFQNNCIPLAFFVSEPILKFLFRNLLINWFIGEIILVANGVIG